jgi:spore maturation protein A
MLTSCKKAVEISLGLVGIMAFWLGIMKIAQEAGLVKAFAKFISPVTKCIFNEIPPDSPAISNIALNFSANAMGLANSATPFGIKAMQELQKEAEASNQKKDVATNSMCTLLAMNTAGFQLVPTTVLAILVSYGAKNPTEIIIPTLIVTSIAFVSAIFISKILQGVFK